MLQKLQRLRKMLTFVFSQLLGHTLGMFCIDYSLLIALRRGTSSEDGGMIISFLLKTIVILFNESFLKISNEYHSLLSHQTYFLNYCCNKLQYCQLDFE